MANPKSISRAAVFAWACLSWALMPLIAQEPKPPVSVQDNAQVVTLEPGAKPIERDLKGGEKQTYKVHVDSGQFVHFVVDQLGIDVTLTLYAPDGKIASMDSPNGTAGLEQISTIAETGGDYRLEVSSGDKTAKSGRYSAMVANLRMPEEQDKKRIKAERAFFEAVDLYGHGDADSIRMALQMSLGVLPLWHEAEDQYEEAITLNFIGGFYSSAGEKQKALDYYSQALPLERAVGNRPLEAATLIYMGTTQSDLGENQKALEYFVQALAIMRALADRSSEATTLNNIGIVYSNLGEKQKALEYYNQALALRVAIADQSGQAVTLHDIGEV